MKKPLRLSVWRTGVLGKNLNPNAGSPHESQWGRVPSRQRLTGIEAAPGAGYPGALWSGPNGLGRQNIQQRFGFRNTLAMVAHCGKVATLGGVAS